MSDKDDAVKTRQVIKDPVKETRSDREQKRAAADMGGADKSGKVSMRVLVHSPFRDYFDGPAFSITAANATGPFDILPRHHNFISLLTPCEVIVRTVGNGEQKIQISGGIMHVKADQVVVFLDV